MAKKKPTETEDNQKRNRRSYDLEPVLHAAIEQLAAKLTREYKRAVGISEALSILLQEHLAEEIARLQEDEPTEKRGRK